MTHRPSSRRTCILVDLESYSALDGGKQRAAQQELAGALSVAAESAGLSRLRWERQPSGDGELAVLPDEERQDVVIGAFPVALDAELRTRSERTGLRLRLRMAVVYGVVTEADLGYAGHAVVAAARIADAAPVRSALVRATDGQLVLALSSELYRDVVLNGDVQWEGDDFRWVPVERINSDAWITVPGSDPRQWEPPAPLQSDDDPVEHVAPTFHGGTPQGSVYQTSFQDGVQTGFHIGPKS